MKRIYLAGKYGYGKYTIVDDDDYYRVMKDDYSWRYERGHVLGTIHNKNTCFHRYLVGEENIPPGKDLDHINNNPLDNRRCNLRPCTPTQNMYNKIGNGQKNPDSFTYSPFKGVRRTTKKDILAA